MMAAPLLSQLAVAKNGLWGAQIAYCGAVTSHVEVKLILEMPKAVKLCEGVEGKNEKERAVRLRLGLASEYTTLQRPKTP